MRIKEFLAEDFADGNNPENKGDSARHGIPKKATATELRSAAQAKGRKGQLARWQMNMRGIKQTEDIAEEISWATLDQGMSMQDKMDVFEEYYTLGNLTESNEESLTDYFRSLNSMSTNPGVGGQYIVVPMALVQNKIRLLDAPAWQKFLGSKDGALLFKSDSGQHSYPSETIGRMAVYNTFTFPKSADYNKFRSVMELKFNLTLPALDITESTHDEIHNYNKLDKILNRLCEMVEQGQHSDQDYGMVAAAVLDPSNRVVGRLNSPGQDDLRVHAERAAMQAYNKKYGEIPEGSIIITTCSPCNEDHTDMARARFGNSCTDYINEAGISKVYCGYIDPSQHNDTRQFNLMETADQNIRQQCEQFASTFVDAQYLSESICDSTESNGIFDDFEHSVTARGLTEDYYDTVTDEQIIEETAAWRRSAGKSKSGGLNAKGVASYRRENPGSKLQTAVTTKPSKLKKGSKAAKRRKSFCARMGGVKGPMKKPNGKPTRKALALRKWNC